MAVDKHVMEHLNHADKNLKWLGKNFADIEELAKSSSVELMRALVAYLRMSLRTTETVFSAEPLSRVEELAKKLSEIYHQTARGVAVLDVRNDRVDVFVGRPRMTLMHEVKTAYLLGRVQGLLGACWEISQTGEKVIEHLAPIYVRALMSACAASYEAWKAIVERGSLLPEVDHLQEAVNHMVLANRIT